MFKEERDILGKNFLVPGEVAEYLGMSYGLKQMKEIFSSRLSVNTLQLLKNQNCGLMFAPAIAMDLSMLYSVKPEDFYFKPNGWYEELSKDKTSFRWLPIRLDALPESCGRDWISQRMLLSPSKYVPNIAEMGFFSTVFSRLREPILENGEYLRTSSEDSDGHHLMIGGNDKDGIEIIKWSDKESISNVGLAVAEIISS